MRQRQLLLAILYNFCVQMDRCFFILNTFATLLVNGQDSRVLYSPRSFLICWACHRLHAVCSMLHRFQEFALEACVACFAVATAVPRESPKNFFYSQFLIYDPPEGVCVCSMHRFPSLVNMNQSKRQCTTT